MNRQTTPAMSTNLLKQALGAIVRLPHPGTMLEGEQIQAWLHSAGLVEGKIDLNTGEARGFNGSGMLYAGQIAQHYRAKELRYHRGVEASAFVKHIAELLLTNFDHLRPEEICEEHIVTLDKVLDEWFRSEAVKRRHYVPCVLTPYPAQPIAIGPVTFIHQSQLQSHPLGYSERDVLDAISTDLLAMALTERAGAWVAVVDIENCVPRRSSDLADLAVDIAIGVLQLIIHPNLSRRMARVTARTLPPWRGNLSTVNGQLSSHIENLQPGRELFGPELDDIIRKATYLPATAGHCLSVFLSGKGSLTTLRHAWCDAMYWFHEGLVEPLDSIAVAKLETSVEVLLRAESTKGSSTRMREALKILTGLAEREIIDEKSGTTVKQFSDWLVGARSRVLHGTSPTLLGELAVERNELMALVHKLLFTFSIFLEIYEKSDKPEDSVNEFVQWILANRQKKNEDVGS